MKPSPFLLERYFARHEFTAPYLLCSSDCEAMSLDELMALEPDAWSGLKSLWLGYTESQGHPELRREIAGLYANIPADNILVHAGAQEAIFNFMNAMLTARDHVIVHGPCYQSLSEIPRAIGCDVTVMDTYQQQEWVLDIKALAVQIRPNTKAIVINTPHNPTGYLMPQADFRRLIELASAHDLYLFSDEVYRLLEYDPADRLPPACDLYEKAVSLGVMSKSLGLAGLRIGWIATQDEEILIQMKAFKDYTSICNSAPSEFLAAIALRHREQILSRNLGIIQSNLKLLDPFFERTQHTLRWVRPKAGAIAFPSLELNVDIEAFCEDLVEKTGVLLLPSTKYLYEKPHFRLGFARKNMPEALARLEQYLAKLPASPQPDPVA